MILYYSAKQFFNKRIYENILSKGGKGLMSGYPRFYASDVLFFKFHCKMKSFGNCINPNTTQGCTYSQYRKIYLEHLLHVFFLLRLHYANITITFFFQHLPLAASISFMIFFLMFQNLFKKKVGLKIVFNNDFNSVYIQVLSAVSLSISTGKKCKTSCSIHQSDTNFERFYSNNFPKEYASLNIQ